MPFEPVMDALLQNQLAATDAVFSDLASKCAAATKAVTNATADLQKLTGAIDSVAKVVSGIGTIAGAAAKL